MNAIMIHRTSSAVGRAVLVLAAASLAASCRDASGPGASSPVVFQLGAATNAASASRTPSGPLELTRVRVVVGAASLGNGDQFGCVDCEGDDGAAPKQQLLDVPLGGGAVTVATEQVKAGRYAEAEISVESPLPETVAKDSSWPTGATMEIVGRFNGTAFRLPLTAVGVFHEMLSPPVDVSSASPQPASLAVRLTVPVATWFVANGVALDPAVPTDRAQIEANARAAIRSTETPGETPREP